MIELDAGAYSACGPRPTNEDYHARHVPEADVLARKGAVFVLADGVGGSQAGEVASRTAVTTFVEQYYSPLSHPRIEPALQRAVQAANLTVFHLAESDARYRAMATTLDVLVLTPSLAYLAHVGDGRAYRLRDGTLQLLTQDHSEVAELMRMRLVRPEKLRDHPRRGALTRTVGTALIVRPDFVREPLANGDRFLLCTDGLWGTLDEAEIEKVLRDQGAASACERLVEHALARGADDNVTVQVIDVSGLSPIEGPPADEDGLIRRLTRRFVG